MILLLIEISKPHEETIENVQKSPALIPSRKKVMQTKPLRRSGRLSNLQTRATNKEMPLEEIELDDNEEEDEPFIELISSEPAHAEIGGSESKIIINEKEVPLDEQFNSEPTPTDFERMERKIDFLVQSVKEFQSQGLFSSETSNVEAQYRNLYFKSQKKIEELMKENQELAHSLELAKQKNETINVTMALMKANETIASLASHVTASKTNLVDITATHDAPGSVDVDEKNNAARSFSRRYSRRKM
ncbi:OLC1v1007320C1 [Oldenlandia corymbosa var. corymbosa]|uniref:OLC1v1007320C1 n=1 Tax=Oldenlandia corymbosa var. corymbosa TaxID=529605 RepID=A0AAV1DJ08_OLDCO|nr:OLC1v1007320C1 [Oldenlandia corymbosa var. corymbosa]